MNKTDQRAKDRPTPEFKMVDVVSKPKFDLLFEERTNSDRELDSNPESDSEETNHLRSVILRYRIIGRNLKKISRRHWDIGEVVLVLDELELTNCLTKDRCNSMKEDLKEKILFSKDDQCGR